MAGGTAIPHAFGGAWTEIKLDAVSYYLECYTKALSNTSFDLWYIDAFAGTGSREAEKEIGGLFEGRPRETVIETLAGSARRALAIVPPFHDFVFIEKSRVRREALEQVRAEHADKRIEIVPGDANAALCELVRLPRWRRGTAGPVRGVVFLDPYSLQVDWATLEALAATQALDVWYLFPLRDVTRQLALDFRGIGPKEEMLDRVLGREWRELYKLDDGPKVATLPGFDLFADKEEMKREAKYKQIEAWFRGRLQSIFPYVSEPLPINTAPTRQAFSLFLAVSNPKSAATDLAAKFERYATRQNRPAASRRKSGL
ncbi:three-Cys-motif partner protein [Methylobacterium sp. OAE515]|uniref:three-Cys-motif partner protein TcmP n=1 Tax=Methylobacterium sp. OAE515 TaxID=2817895 RepID=UPI00178AE6D9